jgi:hypothetical protein
MSKLLKMLASFLMLLGWLGSPAGPAQAKALPADNKEPVKQQVDPASPIYLQHGASDYALTIDGDDAAKGKMTIVHWNHWSHGDHFSHHNHGSHGSHWNGW